MVAGEQEQTGSMDIISSGSGGGLSFADRRRRRRNP
jgi:hypothetical protein